MKFASRLKLLFLMLAILGMLACNASQTLLATSTPLSAPVSPPANSATPAFLSAPASPSAKNATPTLLPALPANPYDEAAMPQKDIDAALANAQKDGKLVLLDFGANWCLDCVALSRLFEDPSVHPYLQDHFYVVRINVGQWDKNLDISQKYGKPIDNGIPAVVVLTPNGDILATTKDGALANARWTTPQEILGYLKAWVAKKP
jgi:thiol:disulfide interchange protein